MAKFEFEGLSFPHAVLNSLLPFRLVIDLGNKKDHVLVSSPKSTTQIEPVKPKEQPTRKRSSCRKSTCPPILTSRPEKKRADKNNDSDCDSDSDVNLWSDAYSDSTIGEDFTDDEIDANKRSGAILKGDKEKVTRKRVKKSEASLSKPSVQQIIENDLFLQLQPRVHILRLPSFMVNSDDKAADLEQVYKVFETNLFRDIDCVARYSERRNNFDYDDDFIPNILPSQQLSNPRKRGILELGSDDDDDDDDKDMKDAGGSSNNLPAVEKKRARMSSSKPRKRVVVADSDDSESDDMFDDEDDGEIMLDSDDYEENDDENELTEGRETLSDTEAMFKKKRKRKFARRKRYSMITLSSDDEQVDISEVIEEEPVPDQDAPISSQKSDRKEIRRVLSEAELEKATKEATSKERKRMERINEMIKQYDKILPAIENERKEKPLILDIDIKTKKVRVEVTQKLVKDLKPHQFEGLKFLYYSTIESIEKITEEGSGCILAHCMGLGKTLQVITFVQTLLSNEYTNKQIRTILIAVPVNTLKNWSEEFDKWITRKRLRTFNIYEMVDECDTKSRAHLLCTWKKEGGVMIIGLPIFASLMSLRDAKKKNATLSVIKAIEDYLSDPGPDLLIIDEGHLLKNTCTRLCKSVEKVKTKRKIMLTGTPLQNNLDEYRTMINIIKPRLLGSAKEFANRFRNPIENGQKADSNARDVSLMKKRAMILHKLLDGCIQRFGHDTLKPFLQPKLEYALYIRPSICMAKMYNYYLDHSSGRALLWDATVLRLCINHPALYYMAEKTLAAKASKVKKVQLPADLRPIGKNSNSKPESNQSQTIPNVNQQTESGEASTSSNSNNPVPSSTEPLSNVENNDKVVDKIPTDVDPETEESNNKVKKDWFKQFVGPDDWKVINLSGKLVMLFKILKKCIAIGEKLLVVSQSLETLDLIEKCLKLNNEVVINNARTVLQWVKGKNYFRIDGKTECFERTSQVNHFNNPENTDAKLFLLSTKAGGVGINLFGATRCIIFDVSWNPSDDIQAIFRIYRLGQSKPVYVYRFVAKDSMEEKIFRKQIVKLGMAIRVLDKAQVKRNFKTAELREFYTTRPNVHYDIPVLNVPQDHLLADLLCSDNNEILDCTVFDSLLEKKPEEDLTEDERQAAWAEYQKERDAEIQAAEERKQQMEEERKKAEKEAALIEAAKLSRLAEEAKQKINQQDRAKNSLAAAALASAPVLASTSTSVPTPVLNSVPSSSSTSVSIPRSTQNGASVSSPATPGPSRSTSGNASIKDNERSINVIANRLSQSLTAVNSSNTQATPTISQVAPNLILARKRGTFAYKHVARARPAIPNTRTRVNRSLKAMETIEEKRRKEEEATVNAINQALPRKRGRPPADHASSSTSAPPKKQPNNERSVGSREDSNRNVQNNDLRPYSYHYPLNNSNINYNPAIMDPIPLATPTLRQQGPYSNLNQRQGNQGYPNPQIMQRVQNSNYQPPPQAHSTTKSHSSNTQSENRHHQSTGIPSHGHSSEPSSAHSQHSSSSSNFQNYQYQTSPPPSQHTIPPPYTSNPFNFRSQDHNPSQNYPSQRAHSNVQQQATTDSLNQKNDQQPISTSELNSKKEEEIVIEKTIPQQETNEPLNQQNNAGGVKILYQCPYCSYKSPKKRIITVHMNPRNVKGKVKAPHCWQRRRHDPPTSDGKWWNSRRKVIEIEINQENTL
ncbi:transcriptional regulator ATRX homolog isoform X3 [Tetranychus urticae]|uniref:transcriptional regulator ATRX homolog isoform X3 n=1 Tax=Tetranychus urticae TaxID=32264 RepID=UPI00077B98FF|nr:transcriptional regulator ATRX homolog isoform X3 [Tetranychus urticae]